MQIILATLFLFLYKVKKNTFHLTSPLFCLDTKKFAKKIKAAKAEKFFTHKSREQRLISSRHASELPAFSTTFISFQISLPLRPALIRESADLNWISIILKNDEWLINKDW